MRMEVGNMPILEFECEGCDIITDSLEKLGTEVIECPLCGELAVQIIKTPPLMRMGNYDQNKKWTGDAIGTLAKMRKEKTKKKKQYYLPKRKESNKDV